MSLQRLGPFELLKVLGRGGMGTVYEAREPGSAQRVAVKALAPQFSFDDRFRARFEAEIDALMKLEHENIVRLLSYGQDEGNLFFAMELVDGHSLFQEQKAGHVFHWREIIEIGKQVCAGLRHAHERGIIHRDLKPGNLMIDANRRVKITDFGIAKSFGSSSQTREGNVLGTMDFMSPEQARGAAVTVRSDLFSLGAVMYALLAGRPPFLLQTVEQTFEALLSDRPPTRLDKVARDTPPDLADFIHRLLEKSPAQRLATAMAARRQLEHVAENVRVKSDSKTEVLADDDEHELVPGSTFAGDDSVGGQTVVSTDRSLTGSPVSGAMGQESELTVNSPDYFNTVTPQQRESGKRYSERDVVSNPWPLVIALVVVLGIAAFGIWYTLIRTPSAEDMLAEIRNAERAPHQVIAEMERFLANYPEHEEAPWVEEQIAYGQAVRFRNNISLKSRIPNSVLSAVELKFLEIVSLPKADAPEALERMRAFIALYGDSTELSDDDQRVVEASRIFLNRLASDSEAQIQQRRESIIDGMKRAERMQIKKEQLAIYQSIVDLYGGEAWASELIAEVNERIAELKNGGQP